MVLGGIVAGPALMIIGFVAGAIKAVPDIPLLTEDGVPAPESEKVADEARKFIAEKS